MAEQSISLDALQVGSIVDRLGAAPQLQLLHVRGTPAWVARVRDVLYLPDSHVQVACGNLVPLEANSDILALSVMQRFAKDGRVRATYEVDAFKAVEAEVCVLSNIFSNSFFHWTEELYKVVVLEQAGFQGAYVVHDFPDYTVGWLEALGIGPHRIIRDLGGPARFASAVFTPAVGHATIAGSAGIFRELRQRLLESGVAKAASPPRLWLERQANTYGPPRRTINAEEVRRCYAEFGFESIDLGAMPAREQVGFVQAADVIAGCHGAAFVHAMFLRPHSPVVECFSPKYINPSILEICRLLKHRYFQLVHPETGWAPYLHGSDIEIDLVHLRLTLEDVDRTLQARSRLMF